jgi:phage-related protein
MAENFNNLTYDGIPIPNPSKGFSSKITPRVSKAQFGDGYQQRIAAGINTLNQTWSINWNSIPVNAATTILGFFAARAGVDYFLWTPPSSTIQYKVICNSWDITHNSHLDASISCEFEKVFDL